VKLLVLWRSNVLSSEIYTKTKASHLVYNILGPISFTTAGKPVPTLSSNLQENLLLVLKVVKCWSGFLRGF